MSGLVPPIGSRVRTAEAVIRELATRSHGVVARTELIEAGVTAKQIENRLGKGMLIPVHRGIYRVGHIAPSAEARYIAAVKACGQEALLAVERPHICGG